MKTNIKDSVKRLLELYLLNKNLELFYRKILEREKRLFIRSLLSRLIKQKRVFNSEIKRHLMRYAKKEPLNEQKSLNEFRNGFPDAGKEKIEVLCLKMELSSYKLCKEALAKTTIGEVRATLLEHRHQTREFLENLKIMNRYVL